MCLIGLCDCVMTMLTKAPEPDPSKPHTANVTHGLPSCTLSTEQPAARTLHEHVLPTPTLKPCLPLTHLHPAHTAHRARRAAAGRGWLHQPVACGVQVARRCCMGRARGRCGGAEHRHRRAIQGEIRGAGRTTFLWGPSPHTRCVGWSGAAAGLARLRRQPWVLACQYLYEGVGTCGSVCVCVSCACVCVRASASVVCV